MDGSGGVMAQTFVPGPETARAFRDALGRFATGVTVVTCATADGPLGFTANSFASLSLDPPLVLWSPAKASRRYAPFVEAAHFAIHVLGAEQGGMGAGFARDGTAFGAVPWGLNAEGVPVIDGTLARFECARAALHDAGDHTIVVGQVLRASFREGEPLVFSSGRYGGFLPG
jgi:flavin reductase (DIM6/NTAB) family NADH-FMN oxidoreductase RutF